MMDAVFEKKNARKICVYCLRTEHTRYVNILVHVMCLYLDMAPKRYGYLKVLSTLGNRPAFMQHLLYNINTRHPL